MSDLSSNRTVTGLLKHAALHWPQRVYLIQRTGEQLTKHSFAEVDLRAGKIASNLASRGIVPGDHVALWSDNSIEWILAYFALLHQGAVVIPFDPQMSAESVERFCEFAHVKLMLLSTNLESRWTAIPFNRAVAQLEEVVAESADESAAAPRRRQPDDTAMIIFTSGTTGDPKGVVLTHENLVADALGVTASIQVGEHDNFQLLLPLFHTYSCTVNLLCSLAGGARATLATSFKSRDIVDDIRIAKITLLIGVPQIYENVMQSFQRGFASQPVVRRALLSGLIACGKWLRACGISATKPLLKSVREKAGFASIRIMVSGGAALRMEVNNFFANLGFDLVQGYGLTEASPVLSFNPPDRNRIGSCGPPVRGAEFRIDNPDAAGLGEICARGPMIMAGYYKNEQATAKVLRAGWLYTGDAGYLDPHGYLHITGRLKNVIVTAAGKNIYPEEIEAELDLSPYILESLVLAVPNRKSGAEDLVAWLVPDPAAGELVAEHNSPLDVPAEIAKAVEQYNRAAPLYRQVRRWKIREQEFEKTSTRKIRRFMYKNFDES